MNLFGVYKYLDHVTSSYLHRMFISETIIAMRARPDDVIDVLAAPPVYLPEAASENTIIITIIIIMQIMQVDYSLALYFGTHLKLAHQY